MAPEVLCCPPKVNPSDNKSIRQLQYNSSVDSWAVGVLAYELLVGFPPFASNSANDSVTKIMSNQVVYPKRMGDAAKSFIDEALSSYPGDRPTALEMLHSSWVKHSLIRGYCN
jgi:aurora kinase